MNFRCANCGVDLNAHADSVLINSAGKLAHFPWFRDERGLNVNATTCLHCGTVHATTGSPLKGLFTLGQRMLSVQFHLTQGQLHQVIRERGNPLPPKLTSLLEERGFLGVDDEPAGDDDEDLTAWGEAVKGAMWNLVLYCSVARDKDFSAASVVAFLQHGAELEAQGHSTPQTVAAAIILDALDSGITAEELARDAQALHTARWQ